MHSEPAVRSIVHSFMEPEKTVNRLLSQMVVLSSLRGFGETVGADAVGLELIIANRDQGKKGESLS